MSKRRKPIDEQGHEPRPAKVPAAVECSRCYEVRLKTSPWRVPCSRRDKSRGKWMGE